MTSPFTRVLIVTTIAVLAGQLIGIVLYRRQRRPAGFSSAP
jgi:hypothetical protein